MVEQGPCDDRGLLQPDNDFWRFSLRVYDQEGVPNECLELQDLHGVNVNLLLFCAWIGPQAITLNRSDIEGATQIVAHWDAMVVRPLRSARQEMKADPDMAIVRARVKAMEIEAERIEQAMLFAHARCIRSADAHRGDTIAHNVNQCVAVATNASLSKAAAPCLIEAARRERS
ncbi:MAG: TIGR02444 family protein [Pseudolabrys sp.]